jgi:hypothetical protein
LALSRNDYNHCAVGFHFTGPRVTFGGVSFSVDGSATPSALTVASAESLFNCKTTAADPGVITVNGRGTRLWLIGAADNDPPFPNRLVAVAIHYADGSSSAATIREFHTGLSGFIEFSSWGRNGRADLAIYSTLATDGFSSGTASLYEFVVDLDPTRVVGNVSFSPPATINTAYVYAATLARE